jgi:hypothetical protein
MGKAVRPCAHAQGFKFRPTPSTLLIDPLSHAKVVDFMIISKVLIPKGGVILIEGMTVECNTIHKSKNPLSHGRVMGFMFAAMVLSQFPPSCLMQLCAHLVRVGQQDIDIEPIDKTTSRN